ncbi:MAG: hypothetical protein ABI612_20420 [Betaproteobacteria bacterium]
MHGRNHRHLENKIVDGIFCSQTFTQPTSLYVDLFTTTATGDAAGVSGTEVSTSGNYGCVTVACGLSTWAARTQPFSAAMTSGVNAMFTMTGVTLINLTLERLVMTTATGCWSIKS